MIEKTKDNDEELKRNIPSRSAKLRYVIKKKISIILLIYFLKSSII